MPLTLPADDVLIGIEDRMRAFLAADADLTGLYTAPIREYPILGVSSTEEVVVSLHTVDSDIRPVMLQRGQNPLSYAPRCLLTIGVHEAAANESASGREGAQVVKSYQRCWNLSARFVRALWRYRRDPTPGDVRWVHMNWPQTPTILIQREEQALHVARIQFQLITHRVE